MKLQKWVSNSVIPLLTHVNSPFIRFVLYKSGQHCPSQGRAEIEIPRQLERSLTMIHKEHKFSALLQ